MAKLRPVTKLYDLCIEFIWRYTSNLVDVNLGYDELCKVDELPITIPYQFCEDILKLNVVELSDYQNCIFLHPHASCLNILSERYTCFLLKLSQVRCPSLNEIHLNFGYITEDISTCILSWLQIFAGQLKIFEADQINMNILKRIAEGAKYLTHLSIGGMNDESCDALKYIAKHRVKFSSLESLRFRHHVETLKFKKVPISLFKLQNLKSIYLPSHRLGRKDLNSTKMIFPDIRELGVGQVCIPLLAERFPNIETLEVASPLNRTYGDSFEPNRILNLRTFRYDYTNFSDFSNISHLHLEELNFEIIQNFLVNCGSKLSVFELVYVKNINLEHLWSNCDNLKVLSLKQFSIVHIAWLNFANLAPVNLDKLEKLIIGKWFQTTVALKTIILKLLYENCGSLYDMEFTDLGLDKSIIELELEAPKLKVLTISTYAINARDLFFQLLESENILEVVRIDTSKFNYHFLRSVQDFVREKNINIKVIDAGSTFPRQKPRGSPHARPYVRT